MMMLMVRNHHRTRRHRQIEPVKQHGSGVHVGINAEQAVGEMGGQVEGRARRFVGRSVGSLVVGRVLDYTELGRDRPLGLELILVRLERLLSAVFHLYACVVFRETVVSAEVGRAVWAVTDYSECCRLAGGAGVGLASGTLGRHRWAGEVRLGRWRGEDE